MVIRRPLAERLAAKLIPVESGCIEWQGFRGPRGYGQIGLGSRSEGIDAAHRVAYRLAHGEIPADRFVCHSCDNPPCCNPDHLFLGSPADNVRDMVSKGRGARGFKLPQTRLSEEQVREIRSRYDRSFGPPKLGGRRSNADELASEFGVGRMYIMHIASGLERSAV